MVPALLTAPSALRMNLDELVTVVVSGQVAHPVAGAAPYRIGNDGVARVLPGTGGIVLSHRVGDPCVGLAADHIEPGVAVHNNGREVTGPRNGPNNALLTYACVGNRAEVTTGRARGGRGVVTGKHGGVNHVLIDFPPRVLRALEIGDRIRIVSRGLGLRLPDYPEILVSNADPNLLRRWSIGVRDGVLSVPVTHAIPARIMGSGLGKNSVWRGDYDIQLFDSIVRRRYRLDQLRFGDLVAIVDADARYGPSFRTGRTTLGVVVHGDSTVSGHGPGVAVLVTGPANMFALRRESTANIAGILGIRQVNPPIRRNPFRAREWTCSST